MTNLNTTQVSRDELFARCYDIATAPNVLAKLSEALGSCGLAGDTRRATLLYLATTTRHFEKLVNVVIKGPPAGGKSHLLNTVLAFTPPEAFHRVSGMSPKAIIYSPENFQHRFLVFEEFAGMQSREGNPWVRTFLSEGYLRYEVTGEPDSEGNRTTKVLSKPGPTGLLMTTTENQIHPEDESRMLTFTVDDTPEQTARVLEAQAMRYGTNAAPTFDYAPWHAFADWVATGNFKVSVPYLPKLARLVDHSSRQVKRYFPHLAMLIKAHALIHQASRTMSTEGECVATLDDYAAVFNLVDDIISQGLSATVSPEVRETVEATVSIVNHRREFSEGVPQHALVKKLGLDKGTISHRVAAALSNLFLINEETRQGRPHKLKPGEPMPNDTRVLPTVDELREAIEESEAR